jgi:hypothetical protein
MSIKIGHHPERDVGRRADVEGDALLGQVGQQSLIMDRRDAVFDPFGVQTVQGVPDGLRPGGLAGMRDAVQPCRPGSGELLGEHRSREAQFRAAHSEADQAGHVVVEGGRGRHLRRGQPEVGRDVEDPAQDDSMITLRRLPGILDCLEEGLDRQRVGDRDVGRHGQLGVADRSLGQFGCDLIGEQPDVLGGLDQIDDREVVADEVRKVLEDEEVAQGVGVTRHDPGVPGGQLGHDPGGGRADLVHVQLGLGQAGDEVFQHNEESGRP